MDNPRWEVIADEWLNRGFHSEVMSDGRIRMWYDGTMRTVIIDGPLKPFPESIGFYDDDDAWSKGE